MASEFAHLHLVICFGHVEVRSPQSSHGSKVKSLRSTAPKSCLLFTQKRTHLLSDLSHLKACPMHCSWDPHQIYRAPGQNWNIGWMRPPHWEQLSGDWCAENGSVMAGYSSFSTSQMTTWNDQKRMNPCDKWALLQWRNLTWQDCISTNYGLKIWNTQTDHVSLKKWT